MLDHHPGTGAGDPVGGGSATCRAGIIDQDYLGAFAEAQARVGGLDPFDQLRQEVRRSIQGQNPTEL
jgi:hypothetical protein